MAQDTHLFSVSKPRQTLGNLHYNSSLPQPTSAMKRSSSVSGNKGHHLDAPSTVQHTRSQSSSRMSMMPSRPPQPNFGRASVSGNNMDKRRMSYAPGSVNPMMTPHHAQSTMTMAGPASAVQRRSSVWSSTRPSSGPAMNQQQSFFSAAPLPAGVPADIRRPKDRQVQNQMSTELEQYAQENNLVMETKHSIQPNAFRSPTQKDFTVIFQWLYKRIDPGYVFQKGVEVEIPALLQQLRYPFAKSITKSQLTAVGGQNWHGLLAMLHWLMQLANMMDGYSSGAYDQAIEEEGIDVSGDRIIFRFLSRAYKAWSSAPGDMPDEEINEQILPEYVEEMAREFEDNRKAYVADLEMLEAENSSLQKQIEEEEAAVPDMAKLDKERDLLEEDAGKFEAYAKKMITRLSKTEENIRLLKEEMIKVEDQIEQAVKDKEDLQEAVDRQGITIQQIDQMNSERERLQIDTESVRERLEKAQADIKEREHEATTKLTHLESLAREYNSLCYDVDIREEEYELLVQVNESHNFSSSRGSGDRLLADSETGYAPGRILNLDMRGKVKNHITGMRREIDSRRAAARKQDQDTRALLIDTASAIDDKEQELAALLHKEQDAHEEYERTKETTSTQKVNYDAEIERTEKELLRMRSGLTDDVQLWEQRAMNADLEYEEMTMRADALRDQLRTEIERMLDYVIKFKLHVQKELGGFEEFVAEESERELAFDEQCERVAEKQGEMGGAGKVEEAEEL